MIIPIIQIALGLSLIFLGRRLFWLFVAAMGFVSGIEAAEILFPGQARWLLLLFALLAGAIGALLAVFLQKLAVGIAGFLAGGFLTLRGLVLFGWDQESYAWLLLLLGAILGVVLVIILFEWALIFLSSLVGAALAVEALHLGAPLSALLITVLFIVGIVAQASRRGEKLRNGS